MILPPSTSRAVHATWPWCAWWKVHATWSRECGGKSACHVALACVVGQYLHRRIRRALHLLHDEHIGRDADDAISRHLEKYCNERAEASCRIEEDCGAGEGARVTVDMRDVGRCGEMWGDMRSYGKVAHLWIR